MHIALTKEEFFQRNGVLDELLSKLCDSCLLVDKNGIIIQRLFNKTTFGVRPVDELIGKHFSESDTDSPFQKVLDDGTAELDVLVVLNDKKCITNVFPVKDQGEVIGAIGMVLFRNMSGLRSILSQLEARTPQSNVESSYDKLSRIENTYSFSNYIGESPIVKSMLAQAQRAALSNKAVLIVGETGTGKEIVAGGIHSFQKKSFTPFIKINCSAIPDTLLESELFGYEKGAFTGASSVKKGKFELAAGGSILLDEIGEMDLRLQGKLLRVLEEQEFERVGGTKMLPLNARIIASTNRDLYQLCEAGKFRYDLYFRLGVLEINTPPLRDHIEDIPLLVEHITCRDQLDVKFSDAAIHELQQMNWPGNVRQLRNILNRVAIFSTNSVVSAADIQAIAGQHISSACHSKGNLPPERFLHAGEKSVWASPMEISEYLTIRNVLERNKYNITRAAQELKITRATLYKKIKKYGL